MNILERAEPRTQVSELHELLNELTDYARTYDKERCFPKLAWTWESTKNFLHYHLNQGTLLFVRDEEGSVSGLTTWWRWNKKDLVEVPKTVLDFVEIIPVKNVDEVLKVALTKPLKRVEWVDVDQISNKEKLKKELSTH